MEIEVIQKELTYYRKTFYVELEINKKIVELTIVEDYNFNGDYTSVDWEQINDEELEDEESDLIDDWVNAYKYEKVE